MPNFLGKFLDTVWKLMRTDKMSDLLQFCYVSTIYDSVAIRSTVALLKSEEFYGHNCTYTIMPHIVNKIKKNSSTGCDEVSPVVKICC